MIEQFVSDLTFDGQRYAVIVRAPVSSGIISAVHLPTLPEGYAFYGASQIPGQKNVEVFEHSIPLFTADEIEYKDQAVGILTGEDEATLEALREDITIELEPIPEDSFEEGRQHTLFDYPIIAREDRTAGNIDAIFETAASTVFSSLKIASQYAARSEPFSAVTVFQPSGRSMSAQQSHKRLGLLKKPLSYIRPKPAKPSTSFYGTRPSLPVSALLRQFSSGKLFRSIYQRKKVELQLLKRRR